MKVGIDLRIVHYAKTGFHRYAQGLVRSLARFPGEGELFVLLQHPDDHSFEPLPPWIQRMPVSTPLFGEHEERHLRDEIEPLQLDVIHFPFSLFPGRLAGRVLLTIHDLTCAKFPQFIEERYRPFYRASLQRAADADWIVADSHHVAAELVDVGFPRHNIQTCYPLTPFEDSILGQSDTVDAALLGRLDGRDYILSVGSIEPRKNYLTALDAFARLRGRIDKPVLFVVVGRHGWLMDPFLEALDRHAYRDDVCLIRDATDATLRDLLRRCQVYLNLSHYEGFGLPVLEALAEGACVLSTPVPSLTESGFPADGFLEETDPETVAARLAQLLHDPAARQELATSSRSAVGTFYRSCDPARFAKMYRL